MRTLGCLLAILTLLAAGCVSTTPAAVTLAEPAPDGSLLRLPLTVHVVAVGFESFDEEVLRAKLAPHTPVHAGIRFFTTGSYEAEALQYDVRYEIHEAPEAFAQALFAHAANASQPGPVDAWLAAYDVAGPGRACTPAESVDAAVVRVVTQAGECGDLDVIDARSVEQWIAQSRAAHGLVFPSPSQTIFVLDSYTKGWLPQERYHRYAIDDGTGWSTLEQLRAWGGEHDFVFLDVGAAPNRYDFRPWLNFSAEDIGWDKEDPPIWDLASDMPAFYANLAQNVLDAVDMLWARDPIYPFEYAERYVLPVHVFIDPQAHAHPASALARLGHVDYEAATDAAHLQAAFQALLPWAEVEVPVTFHYLPEDDAGMAEALRDAKDRADPRYVDFGIVKRYLRENWDAYAPDEPGARVYPTFAFVLDAPSRGLWAYSDGDEVGNSFGVFINVADSLTCVRPGVPVCSVQEAFGEESFWLFWNNLILHEAGHSFGLMHPHDTFDLDEGKPSVRINWLWDSTSSPMTYRHVLGEYNRFDKELILRGNAIALVREVVEAGAADEAGAAAGKALDALRRGDYAAGLRHAEQARGLMGEAGALAAATEAIGTPVKVQVSVPVTGAPLGNLPVSAGPLWLAQGLAYRAADLAGLSWKEVPVEIPEGAQALLIEYRETDLPRHPRWAGFAVLLDHEGESVLGLWNNGYDKAFLLDVERCAEGCTLLVYAYSGAGVSYEVTLTPYMERPAGA